MNDSVPRAAASRRLILSAPFDFLLGEASQVFIPGEGRFLPPGPPPDVAASGRGPGGVSPASLVMTCPAPALSDESSGAVASMVMSAFLALEPRQASCLSSFGHEDVMTASHGGTVAISCVSPVCRIEYQDETWD